MKRSGFAGALVFVVMLMAMICSSHFMVAEAANPQPSKAAPAENLTSQQAGDVHTAWMNLNRAYLDLLSTAPDVKGDTSRLEGALKAAIDDLHELDKSAAAAQPSGSRQDTGKSREYIFQAVQRHLDVARAALQGSKINNSACEHALGQIAIAQGELNAAKAAPVKK